MKRLQLEKNEKNKSRSRGLIKTLLVAVFAVVILEVWTVNRLSTFGSQLSEMKDQEQELSLMNQILENQIAQQSSLISVEQQASILGFSDSKNFDYLKPVTIASAR